MNQVDLNEDRLGLVARPVETVSTLLTMFMAAAATLSSLLLTLALVFAGPHFESIFVDFDTELPRLTVLFIEYRLAFAPLAAAMAVVPVVIVLTVRNPSARSALVMSCFLAGMIFLFTYVASLFLPLVSLIDSVSQ